MLIRGVSSTVQGFRKIDSDRWEFANEGFVRGMKHLLKNIQRRKSLQSQQIVSTSVSAIEAGKGALGGEIERLKKEKSMMMQEVIELQQQQRGTAQHMETVNEKLQAAEKRQKQMVSFLAKMFQNPGFVARLQEKQEQKTITSRTMRKFTKQSPLESGRTNAPQEVQLQNLAESSMDPDKIEQFPNLTVQDFAGKTDLGLEYTPFQIDNIGSDEFLMAHQRLNIPEPAGEGGSSLGAEDLYSRGKTEVRPHQLEVMPKYFVSFPDDAGKEITFPGFSSPATECLMSEEEAWGLSFEADRSINEPWGNLTNYEVPEMRISSGLSDIWGIGPLQAAGSSGIGNWPSDELSPFGELENQALPDEDGED